MLSLMKKSTVTKGVFIKNFFSTEDKKAYWKKIFTDKNKGEKNASCSLISIG